MCFSGKVRVGDEKSTLNTFKQMKKMEKEYGEHKFVAGDIVFAKVNPTLKLLVRRYIDKIYYCRVVDDLERKELVYFERELITTK